ncbi:MAG TPA: DUF2505 family protein [Acidimicrobiales bacterium]|nr:DUF2505 family protein [Acidimicrobiales bacterium]
MRFRLTQAIRAPRTLVEDAFLDPGFYRALGEMPNLGEPEVLDLAEEGEVVVLRVRYRFAGQLPSAARRVLDPAKLTWVQESQMRRSDHQAEFRILPDYYANRLSCQGQYYFHEADEGTDQVVEGDLVVRYPLVGPLVERAILSGMRDHLVDEARILEGWAS